MKDRSRNEGSRNVHHVPDGFEHETLLSVVKRATTTAAAEMSAHLCYLCTNLSNVYCTTPNPNECNDYLLHIVGSLFG